MNLLLKLLLNILKEILEELNMILIFDKDLEFEYFKYLEFFKEKIF